MAIDADAMWKPGYDGPPPRPVPVGGVSPREQSSPAADTGPRPMHAGPTNRPDTAAADVPARGRHRWWIAGAVGVALLAASSVTVMVSSAPDLGASVVDVSQIGDDADEGAPAPSRPLDVVERTGAVFGGADPRHLPTDIAPLWSTPLAGLDGVGLDVERAHDADPSVAVIDSRYVVVAHGVADDQLADQNVADGSVADSSVVTVFDATDGTLMWASSLPGPAAGIGIVGAVDDLLLIETAQAAGRLVALDIESGDRRWAHAETVNDLDVLGVADAFEVVPGTPLVVRRPALAENPTVFIDPSTGSVVGRLDGEILGVDDLGNWYVDDDGDIVVRDLADGFAEGAVLASVDVAGVQWAAVVDEQIVGSTDDGLVFARPGVVGASTAVVAVAPNGVELPGDIAAISPMVEATMLVSGSGDVVGAEVAGDTVVPAWKRNGIVVDVTPTERGALLLVSTRGGAAQEVIDGRSGQTLHSLTMSPGAFDSLVFAGNGFVTRRISELGTRIAGFDLDGDEMWSLPGSMPVAVGDGLVARVEFAMVGPVVTAYGEATAHGGAP